MQSHESIFLTTDEWSHAKGKTYTHQMYIYQYTWSGGWVGYWRQVWQFDVGYETQSGIELVSLSDVKNITP